MSVVVDEYIFEGPYTDHAPVKEAPGVFVIHCCTNGDYTVVDVGASPNLRTSLRDYSRRHLLNQVCEGTLTMSVLYTSGEKPPSRDKVEERIRRRLLVPDAARGRHSVAAKHGTGAAPPE
ncbi:MAG: hypothetical protein R3282_00110 [Rhodothermales bacterium]|nr:hypothetical protein [Rhodothermales bacterium]